MQIAEWTEREGVAGQKRRVAMEEREGWHQGRGVAGRRRRFGREEREGREGWQGGRGKGDREAEGWQGERGRAERRKRDGMEKGSQALANIWVVHHTAAGINPSSYQVHVYAYKV